MDGAATTSDGSTVLSFGSGDQILLEGITDPTDLIESIFGADVVFAVSLQVFIVVSRFCI